MDGKGQTGTERDMLMRIVALLLALADLAERAATRSASVRWLVLSSLWQADDVARHFVTGRTPKATAASPNMTTLRYDPADAMALAASLRTLALLLGTMAARMRRSVPMPGLAVGGWATPTLSKSAFPAVDCHDTS